MSNQTYLEGISKVGAEHFLVRPRIDDLLNAALQKPFTTVIAGAGYGKTLAVSSVLESMQYRYAWLQLSELDNTIAILWKHMVHAVEVHNPQLAQRMDALGYPDSPSAFFRVLRLAEDDLKNQQRFALVLDDFYTIQDETVLSFFERLITACIPNLSIVLISRRNPKMALAKMLSRGLMARVSEEDLRFTSAEMDAYFEARGETLGIGASSSLFTYTEGWILAIYLVGLSMKRRSAYDQNLISRAKIDIFSLIEEEIYYCASEDMQRFLTVISLLNGAPTELLKELAADTPEVLTEMANSDLLIRYDPHSDRCNMHPLFRDFLSEKGVMLTDDEVANAHMIAARWYDAHNYPEEAINHYWQCGRYSEVFDIILSVRNRAAKDVAELFIELIDESPQELVNSRPILRVVRAHHLFNNNRIDEAHEAITVLREEYEALPPTRERASILGEACVVLALISIVKQNLDFIELFKKATEYLPNGSSLIDNHLYIAEGINIIGIEKPVPGELRRYQDAMFEVAPYAAKAMNGCGYGMEYLTATDAAFMVGNIRSAEKYAYETVYRTQQQQQHGIEFMANFYLIRIFLYKGDYTKIAILLKQMREQAERLQNADCMTLFDIIEGWFYVKIEKPTKVAKWIMHEEETRKMLAPVILGREYLVRSDCMLIEGRYYELLGFMKQSDIFYEGRGVLYARIQNKITQAIVHHYLGSHQDSMDALRDAYVLSHANDLVMQYIEYGSQMRAVTKAALKDKDCAIPKPWLENIHMKSSTYAKRLIQVEKAYNEEHMPDGRDQVRLSKWELEVLSCLCQGLSREEIADACNLSANTVKKIQQNIYNKLGANNGLDAVRIATTMGLL